MKKRKPPLGLIPFWFVREQRMLEIHLAIRRYELAKKKVPTKWKKELVMWILCQE